MIYAHPKSTTNHPANFIFMDSFEVIPNNKSHVGIPTKWAPKLKKTHYIKHHYHNYQILINMTYHYRL